jgi:hypothetical protein
MSEGGKAAGKGRPKQGVEKLPPPIDGGKARDQVGKDFGVSGRSVDYATKVLREAVPEVVEAVDKGEVTVNGAAVEVPLLPERSDFRTPAAPELLPACWPPNCFGGTFCP